VRSKDAFTHDLLVAQGYKFIDDAWNTHGRRTYIHDEDATRAHVKMLAGILRDDGWKRDTRALLRFHQAATSCIIELEPGGSETTGHFLHYMKASESEPSA
jgi:hypothetical protein